MSIKQRLISAALCVGMTATMIAPVAVSANSGAEVNNNSYNSYSVEQLESLIAKLQKQLAELKKGSKCFVSDRDLSLGDGEPGDGYDGHVRKLQTFLKEKNYFTRSATGYFGKVTRAALQAYQKANGLPLTGEFDGSTRGKAHGQFCKQTIKAAEKAEKKVEKKTEEKTEPVSAVSGISLTVTDGVARWTVNGKSAMGFKVVWSKNAGPTYPTRDGDRYNYLSESSATQSSLEAFDGSGTYRVRVCEYLGGKCGVYSNEVAAQL